MATKKTDAADLRAVARQILSQRPQSQALAHPSETARAVVERLFQDFQSKRVLTQPVEQVPASIAAPVEPGQEQFAGPPDAIVRPDMLAARQGIRAASRVKAEDRPIESSEVQPAELPLMLLGGGAGAGRAALALENKAAGAGIREALKYDAAEAAGSIPQGAAKVMKTADKFRAELLGGKTGAQLEAEFAERQLAKQAEAQAAKEAEVTRLLERLQADSPITPSPSIPASEATNVAGRFIPKSETIEKLVNHVAASHERNQSILDRLMNLLEAK